MKKLIKEINLIKDKMSELCEDVTKPSEGNEPVFGGNYIGEKVMVYYNLHKHTFSVSYKNKIILYADYVKLSDVEFRVRQGGKERVRDEMRKNVHAFVIGTLLDYCSYPCEDLPEPPNDKIITYNPYKYDSFVRKDSEEPIYNANEVEMINSKDKVFFISETVK